MRIISKPRLDAYTHVAPEGVVVDEFVGGVQLTLRVGGKLELRGDVRTDGAGVFEVLRRESPTCYTPLMSAPMPTDALLQLFGVTPRD